MFCLSIPLCTLRSSQGELGGGGGRLTPLATLNGTKRGKRTGKFYCLLGLVVDVASVVVVLVLL